MVFGWFRGCEDECEDYDEDGLLSMSSELVWFYDFERSTLWGDFSSWSVFIIGLTSVSDFKKWGDIFPMLYDSADWYYAIKRPSMPSSRFIEVSLLEYSSFSIFWTYFLILLWWEICSAFSGVVWKTLKSSTELSIFNAVIWFCWMFWMPNSSSLSKFWIDFLKSSRYFWNRALAIFFKFMGYFGWGWLDCNFCWNVLNFLIILFRLFSNFESVFGSWSSSLIFDERYRHCNTSLITLVFPFSRTSLTFLVMILNSWSILHLRKAVWLFLRSLTLRI